MLIQDVRTIAKSYGIKTSRITKQNLIKEIQRSEGNFDCFASASDGVCDQSNCLWREDCFTASKQNNLS